MLLCMMCVAAGGVEMEVKEGGIGRRGGRVLRGIGWTVLGVVTFLEVLTMGDSGLSKFQNLDGWMYWSLVSGTRCDSRRQLIDEQ